MRLKDLSISLVSILTRGTMLLSKAVLAIYLVRQMSLGDFGVFSLILTTATIATYLFGLDLYTISTREIPGAAPNTVRSIVQTQLMTHLFCYGAGIFGVYPLFRWGILPSEYLATIYAILVLEHLTHETFRWLVASEKHFFANLVLFSKTTLWVLALLLFPGQMTLGTVMAYWMLGLLVAFAIGFGVLQRNGALALSFREVHLPNVLSKIRQASFFFACTISALAVTYSGRYFIKLYTGNDELVGIYSLFASLVGVMEVTISAAILQPFLPKVIGYQRNRSEKFAPTFRLMNGLILAGAVGMGGGLLLLVPPLFAFLRREDLAAYLPCFYLLLGSAFISTITLVPYNVLYVLGKDQLQMRTSLGGAVTSLLLNFLLIPRWTILGAAVSTLASMGLIAWQKWRAWKRSSVSPSYSCLPAILKWEAGELRTRM